MVFWLSLIYLLAVGGIAVYGLWGAITLWLYWRHRDRTFPCPQTCPADLPAVTIQLPLYNERQVVGRLLAAVVHLDYPPDRLQIQVLDDSTDGTTAEAAALVEEYRAQGVNIHLLHRDNRQGYKAGALAAALPQATGEYLAIFDADFQPPPDFLLQTIPHFLDNPQLGMAQARWSHLNADQSPLTAAQAIALDKHFAMDQTVRHAADLFPRFNGTAGVWRRGCLEEVGGWQADTLCEDLCLSTRAILQGWQFRYLNGVTAAAELPASMTAFKSQQARWTKGSFQCLLKYGRAMLTSRRYSWLARLYALLSMASYLTTCLLLLILLTLPPLIYLDYRFPPYLALAAVFGVCQPLLFVLSQQVLYPDWWRRLRYLPVLLLVAVGIAPNGARAVLQVLFGRQHPFIRTPKGTAEGGRMKADDHPSPFVLQPSFDWIVLVELLLAVYAAVGLWLAWQRANYGPVSLLLTCLLGLSYVAIHSLRERKA